jgi:F420-dependent oxidoreductase-like protein
MQLRIFTEPQQGAEYETLLAVAKTTEHCGFDAFFRSDHYLKMGDGSGLPGPSDAWITLAGLARETKRIRLGTMVTAGTFRLPGPLAISVATVDRMSGGRVELGLGSGWFEAEHTAYGIPFGSLGRRFDRLEEQLQIITGLWSTPVGETYSFDGAEYQLADAPALPRPWQGRIPIIVGGTGPKRTPRLAAQYADEFNVFANLARAAPMYDRVRSACEAAGRRRPILYSACMTTVCGRNDAEIARRADAIGQSVEQLKEGGLCGTPAEIIDTLGGFADEGASRIYLQVMDMADLEHIELLGAEVLPHV